MFLPPRVYVFIGLNIIRALSIIALLLVFTSEIVIMKEDIRAYSRFLANKGLTSSTLSNTTTAVSDIVSLAVNASLSNNSDYIEASTVPNQPGGIFWAIVNIIIIMIQTILLIMSEMSIRQSFFDRYFPVLGKEFGVGALGIIQCLIGATVLSFHVNFFPRFASYFLITIGCINAFILGLVFRHHIKSRRSLTSWRERAKDVLPTKVAGVDVAPIVDHVPDAIHAFRKGKGDGNHEKSATFSKGMGFGKDGQKFAGLQGFSIPTPIESLPRYTAGPGFHTKPIKPLMTIKKSSLS